MLNPECRICIEINALLYAVVDHGVPWLARLCGQTENPYRDETGGARRESRLHRATRRGHSRRNHARR